MSYFDDITAEIDKPKPADPAPSAAPAAPAVPAAGQPVASIAGVDPHVLVQKPERAGLKVSSAFKEAFGERGKVIPVERRPERQGGTQ